MSDSRQFDRRTLLKAAGAASAAGALGGVATATPVHDPGPKEDEIVVGVSAGHDLVETVASAVPPEAAVVHENETLRYVSVKFPEQAADVARENFVEAVTEREGVKYAEPNATYEALYTPNDPQFPNQYAPQQVEAPAAWDVTTGCSDSLVVVVDTGAQYDHPDLADNYRSNPGRDFADGDSDPAPDDPRNEYHATHVSGTAIGGVDNGEGIAGIGNCPVQNCRALDESGSGSLTDIADCIEWAADQGADVINLSLGGGGSSDTLKNAVSYAAHNGALIVAAAGNDGSQVVSYPAAYSECVAVSAVDSSGNLAPFSNYGSSVELCAPGVDVLSTTTTDRGSYEQLSGTSVAAAIVSGVACLTDCRWDLDGDELRDHLVATAKDVGLPEDWQGYGQVDAYAAVTTEPDGGGCGSKTNSKSVESSLDGDWDSECWTYTWEFDEPCRVVAELDGPSSADFDLYVTVRDGSCPTTSDYDFRSITTSSQESVTIDDPDPSSELAVLVDSYSGSGEYTLLFTERA